MMGSSLASPLGLVLAFLLTCWVASAGAQARRPATPSIAPRAIDTAAQVVSPADLSSAQALVGAFRSLQRGSFEPADAYASRVDSAVASRSFLVAIPAIESDTPSSKRCVGRLYYEIDEKQWGLTFLEHHEFDEAPHRMVPFTCQEQRGSRYVGSNAFGVQRTITRWTVRGVGIASLDERDARQFEGYRTLTMAPDSARRVSGHLRIALAFQPAAPHRGRRHRSTDRSRIADH
jgi:hypothetical protein